MRFAFFGDVVGRAGRDGLADHLPGLRRRLGLEFVIVNAENAAAGFGITESTARELFEAGADALTLGNHSWDQKEALTYIAISFTDPHKAGGVRHLTPNTWNLLHAPFLGFLCGFRGHRPGAAGRGHS